VRITDISLLVLCAAGISTGQVFLKLGARSLTVNPTIQGWLGLAFNPYFVAGILLYVALTFVWTWLLSRSPLSQLYPFLALTFVFTPLFAVVALGESVKGTYAIGVVLIAGGIALAAR